MEEKRRSSRFNRKSITAALMKGFRASGAAAPKSAPPRVASRRMSAPGPALPQRPMSMRRPSGAASSASQLTRQRRASLRRPSTLDWEGYLWKRGGGTQTLFSSSAFSRRYFVLDSDGDLFYYKDAAARHAGNNLKRPFVVRGCTVKRGDLTEVRTRRTRRLSVRIAGPGSTAATSDHLVFSIQPSDEKGRTLALCAETTDERDHWIRVLRTAAMLPPRATEAASACAAAVAALEALPSIGEGQSFSVLERSTAAELLALSADPNTAGGALSSAPRLVQLLRAPDAAKRDAAARALLHLATHVDAAEQLYAAGAAASLLLLVRPTTATGDGGSFARARAHSLQALRLLTAHRGCCLLLWRLNAPSRIESVLLSLSQSGRRVAARAVSAPAAADAIGGGGGAIGDGGSAIGGGSGSSSSSEHGDAATTVLCAALVVDLFQHAPRRRALRETGARWRAVRQLVHRGDAGAGVTGGEADTNASALRFAQASVVPCSALLLEHLGALRGADAEPHLELETALLRNLAELIAAPSLCSETLREILDLASFEWLLARLVAVRTLASVAVAAVDVVIAMAECSLITTLVATHRESLEARLRAVVGGGCGGGGSGGGGGGGGGAVGTLLCRRAEHAIALLYRGAAAS